MTINLHPGLNPSEVRLFVGVPAYGGNVQAITSHSLIALSLILHKLGIAFDIQFLFNESLIERARNLLVRMFLDHPRNMTHMLFIDADIEFDARDVLRLLSHKKDVICGVYPKKSIPWDLVVRLSREHPELTSVQVEERALRYFVRPVTSRNSTTIQMNNGVIEAEDCGNGFLMLSRHAIDVLKAAYPHLQDTFMEQATNGGMPNENSWFFFEAMVDPETKRFLSEDYTFIKRWRDAGGKTYADLNIKLGHWGTMALVGNAFEAFVDTEKRAIRREAVG
jgi:hypothetical protein